MAGDREALFANQDPLEHPVGLFEAMARALKYNLVHRIAQLESKAARQRFDLTQSTGGAGANPLFDLTGSAGYAHRSNQKGSSGGSMDAASDRVTEVAAVFSTAEDRNTRNTAFNFTWNIMQFGMAAIQTQDDLDRALIAEENRRLAVHGILRDVRNSFWRAAGAQKFSGAIEPVIQDARASLRDARLVEQEGLKPQLEMLRYQRSLLEIIQRLEGLRDQLANAHKRLAALINLPTGLAFKLDIPNDTALAIPKIRMQLEEMEQLALNNRPELKVKMYDARISARGVKAAVLDLLPDLPLSFSRQTDSNTYALHPSWEDVGIQAVWKLVKLIQAPDTIRMAKTRKEKDRIARLAMHLAILTEVHRTFNGYLNNQRKLKEAEEIDDIDKRIFWNVAIGAGHDSKNRLEYIYASSTYVTSRLQLLINYADAQNAVGALASTLGVDLLPERVLSLPVMDLADKLQDATLEWNEAASSKPWILTPLPPPREKTTPKKIAAAEKENPTATAVEQKPPADTDKTATVPPAQQPDKAGKKSAVPEYFLEPDFSGTMREKMQQESEEDHTVGKIPVESDQKPGNKGAETSQTPAVPPPGTTKITVTDANVELETIRKRVSAWAKAWSERNVEAFLAFYSEAFTPPQARDPANWRKRISDNLTALRFVLVEPSNLTITKVEPKQVRVSFQQDYRSDRYRDTTKKMLLLRLEEETWKIIGEASAPNPDPSATEPPAYAVQFATYSQMENATRQQQALLAKGISTYITPVPDQQGKTFFSVRTGRFKEKNRANILQWSLMRNADMKPAVVPTDPLPVDTPGTDKPVNDSRTDGIASDVNGGAETVKKPINREQ